jgi:protein-tyrosine phosphatase
VIDIHSHLLPGLDDGPAAMEETLAMLEVARASGATAIVATPHADTRYRFDPERVDALLAEVRERAGPGLAIHRGCDFHLMFDNVNDALRHPERYTIDGRGYLLVELSGLVIFPNTGELFDRLEQRGMRIVITHPERNPLLCQRLELLEQWVAEGRLLQITAQSLAGHFGPRARSFGKTLLDRGLAHFIASDAHDAVRRPPRLDHAFAWVRDRYGEPLARALMIGHPEAALAGERIDLTSFPPQKAEKTAFGNAFSRIFRKEA